MSANFRENDAGGTNRSCLEFRETLKATNAAIRELSARTPADHIDAQFTWLAERRERSLAYEHSQQMPFFKTIRSASYGTGDFLNLDMLAIAAGGSPALVPKQFYVSVLHSSSGTLSIKHGLRLGGNNTLGWSRDRTCADPVAYDLALAAVRRGAFVLPRSTDQQPS